MIVTIIVILLFLIANIISDSNNNNNNIQANPFLAFQHSLHTNAPFSAFNQANLLSYPQLADNKALDPTTAPHRMPSFELYAAAMLAMQNATNHNTNNSAPTSPASTNNNNNNNINNNNLSQMNSIFSMDRSNVFAGLANSHGTNSSFLLGQLAAQLGASAFANGPGENGASGGGRVNLAELAAAAQVAAASLQYASPSNYGGILQQQQHRKQAK